MLYFRIILILYVLPLMILSALALVFKKVDWVKYVWIYGTLAILLLIVAVKILFSVVGLIE
jgi:hypothetical protein